MSSKAPAPGAAAPEQINKAPGFFGIEELRSKHKIGRAVFAGVCSVKGWRPGKAVTEEEFLKAVDEFNNAPMSGAPSTKESEAKK